MPINPPAVTPPVPGGVTATDTPTEQPGQAEPVQPPAIGVTASILPPVAAAGVKLARFVLSIAIATIILLLFYLGWMDYKIGSDLRTTYERVSDPAGAGAEFINLGRLERFIQDLDKARTDATLTWDPAALENAQSVLTLVTALPSVTQEQKSQLNACVPPPVGARDALTPCLEILDNLRDAILGAASSAMGAGIANSEADKLGEHREKFHAFWIQAAQLLLLNLLLPLLTALFGYIFGTQQAQRSS